MRTALLYWSLILLYNSELRKSDIRRIHTSRKYLALCDSSFEFHLMNIKDNCILDNIRVRGWQVVILSIFSCLLVFTLTLNLASNLVEHFLNVVCCIPISFTFIVHV